MLYACVHKDVIKYFGIIGTALIVYVLSDLVASENTY